ncbi:hypothetical protein HW130_14435 [Streptomyces sp. PKU-EA00015]|uniref:hypothetical protein n=1 Tax=Streptomyces sp. PKU-EA00015 TaxID=2748326 RepID=UPI0015A1ABE6|nr:hypothetical protein [Streptomyces sp. PKU-EA00015]NWF27447.1 hypothetical protein [Streptomyces sp. PKU-EA00015]
MPNAELAARIRTEITQRPEHHDQAHWFTGDVLRPDEDLDAPAHCGTTLCVAGYAAHFTGHILLPSGIAVLPNTSKRRYIERVAHALLGLTDSDADWLFHPLRAHDEVLAALGQLADGAAAIDTDAIASHVN